MDFKEDAKNFHFSICAFKKSSEISTAIKLDDKKQQLKRSLSYPFPERFVPKLKPKKSKINPSFFILNDKENVTINEISTESKSVKENEDNLSVSSLSESFSELEDKNQHKYNNFNECNTNFSENYNNKSLSTLFIIRKKMLQIKNSLCLNKIKECIDLGLLNLKSKFNLEEKNQKNENYNLNKYKSIGIVNNNKNGKKLRPFLIFDVLSEASQINNI